MLDMHTIAQPHEHTPFEKETTHESTIGQADDAHHRLLDSILSATLHDAIHAICDDDYRHVQAFVKNLNPRALFSQILNPYPSPTIRGHAARLYVSHPQTNPEYAIRLLRSYKSELIRMGALLGLEDRMHFDQDAKIQQLIAIFKEDPCPEIRQEASEILEDHG